MFGKNVNRAYFRKERDYCCSSLGTQYTLANTPLKPSPAACPCKCRGHQYSHSVRYQTFCVARWRNYHQFPAVVHDSAWRRTEERVAEVAF